MEINTSSMIDQQQTATMQQIQVSLFKKAIDMNAQAALTLIGAALPQTEPVAQLSTIRLISDKILMSAHNVRN